MRARSFVIARQVADLWLATHYLEVKTMSKNVFCLVLNVLQVAPSFPAEAQQQAKAAKIA